MTHIRLEVSGGKGNLNRLRTTGEFLGVRSLTARSYFDDVGRWPTSKALIYLAQSHQHTALSHIQNRF